MKKTFVILASFVITLLCGVILTACQSSVCKISFVNNSTDLVETVVKVNKIEQIPTTENSYSVDRNSNVRVEFYSKSYGTDISNISVTINGVEKTVFKNNNYNPFELTGDLYIGYLLIGQINEDSEIVVGGAEVYKNVFTFEGENLNDEKTAERLKSASISLDGQQTYTTLYDFLTSDKDKSVSFNIFDKNEEVDKIFYIKFDQGNPYALNAENPFKVVVGEQEMPLEAVTFLTSGAYGLYLPDIGIKTNAKIKVDFQNLALNEFQVVAPEQNQSFSIEVGASTLNVETETTLTVTKLLSEDVASYDEMEVYLNETKLNLLNKGPVEENQESDVGVSQNNDENENTVVYVIPKGLTPFGTGGDNNYVVKVKGITYSQETFVLTANPVENEVTTSLVQPKVTCVDDHGQDSGIFGFNDSQQEIATEGQRCALVWGYSIINGYYHFAYDLYDFDITLNGSDVILNMKTYLEGKSDDQIIELENGYTLRAYFNSETNKFDKFQLEFNVSQNMSFAFGNFKNFTKHIKVGYEFNDERVEEVAYYVGEDGVNLAQQEWTNLDKGTFEDQAVVAWNIVYFRLKIKDDVANHEFSVNSNIALDGVLEPEDYSDEQNSYKVFKFRVSDVYFDQLPDVPTFKLIKSGTLEK